MIYCFGRFELDDEVFELRRDHAKLAVRRRSFDVLRLLIAERHRVVSKEELLDRIWERRFVSESALATCISELRSALDSNEVIRTAYGRGYRFALELHPAVGSYSLLAENFVK